MVKVQWSADAAPISTATAMPSPCCSWLAWTRGSSPRAIPASEDLACLVGAEGPSVAEDVDPPRVRRAGVEHLADDEGDVAVRVVGELSRHDVGAEVGGLLGDLAGQAQGPRLVDGRQAVAGLRLERGDATAVQLAGQAREPASQIVIGRGAGALDGAADAARGVRLAGHARGELVSPVAGEHQVGVAVDEARQHGAAVEVDDVVGGAAVGVGAHPRDPPVLDDDGRVAQDAEGSVADRGVVRDERPDVDECGAARPEGLRHRGSPAWGCARRAPLPRGGRRRSPRRSAG